MQPKLTRDLAQARADLAAHGFCLIDAALSREETRAVRGRLLEAAQEDVAGGRGYVYDRDETNQRVWALVNRGQCFIDLVEHATATELVHHLLGDRYLLSNISANITGPGGGLMHLHADQIHVPPPWPDYPYAANAIWMLDDFTDENGATRYVPGSHKVGHGPIPGWPVPETRAMEGPAGTLAVMDGRVWHQTGENRTASQRRAGIFAYYVRPFMRTQENWALSLDRAILERASPRLRDMLGFAHYHSLGIVNGMPLDERRF